MNEIDVVVDVRQSPDTAELIVSKQKVAFSGEARTIGSPVETRIGLTSRKAKVSVFAVAEPVDGFVIAARVKNVGAVPFAIDRVVFEHQYRQVQTVHVGSMVAQQPTASVALGPQHPEKEGLLQPGEASDYYLPHCLYDGVALTVVSLPPTQFWIAVYSEKEEVGRVAGKNLQPFFDRTGIKFHRRAMPLFGTLPESDRLSVIKAAAPLRGREKEQWPSAGAEPLDDAPHIFVVRAGEDLGVLVTPTEDRGVEIVDIVHPSALEQSGQAVEGAKQ